MLTFIQNMKAMAGNTEIKHESALFTFVVEHRLLQPDLVVKR